MGGVAGKTPCSDLESGEERDEESVPCSKVMKTLLVVSPFSPARRPSIALHLLKAALESAGHACDLLYLNLTFAEKIGVSRYREIGEQASQEHLAGELVFNELIFGAPKPAEVAEQEDWILGQAYLASRSSEKSIPSWFVDELVWLREKAAELMSTLVSIVDAGDYDLFGAGTTFQTTPALACLKVLKEHNPRALTIVGGNPCSGVTGEELVRVFGYLDLVVRGDGESVITKLAAALSHDDEEKKERMLAIIPGLIWRSNGELVSNDGCGRERDLDSLSMPDYTSWMEQLATSRVRVDRSELSIPLETSRGCWYGRKRRCVFCGFGGPDLTYTKKSTRRVIREFESVSEHGIENVDLVDLAITSQSMSDLMPRIGKYHKKILCDVKPALPRERLEEMKQGGVRVVQAGMESLSTDVLGLMNKNLRAWQGIRFLRWAAELGVEVKWNILWGFPGEENAHYEEIGRLVPLLRHLTPPVGNCVSVLLNRFSPLYEERGRFGLVGVKPAPVYEAVYWDVSSDESLARLAYFFEYKRTYVDSQVIEKLKESVERWKSGVGDNALVQVTRDGETFVYDSRAEGRVETRPVDDLESELLRLCAGGLRVNELRERSHATRSVLLDSLEVLVELGWILEVDDRLLTLTVDMTDALRGGIPRELLGPAAAMLYEERMKKMTRTE